MKTRFAGISLSGLLFACHAVAAPLPAEVQKREAFGPLEQALILLTPVQDELDLSGDWKARFMPPEKAEVLARHAAELLKDGLTPRQSARLRAMAWQVRGPAALDDEAVIAALNLTADQRETLGSIAKEFRAERDRYLSGAVDGDETKLHDELGVIRTRALSESVNGLTPRQKELLERIMFVTRSGYDPGAWSLQRLACEGEGEK